MAIQQITIVGVGLIGGSFALALKKRGFHGQIVGCDNDLVLEKALAMGVVDRAESRPEQAIRKSEVVLLATPVGAIIDLLQRIGPSLADHQLLTEVGSTKSETVAAAERTFGRKAAKIFLPGHPMAGKAHSGITQADAELFQGAVWIFTEPHAAMLQSPGLAAEFADLVRRTGARPVTMEVARHDRLCAWVSHLPQMISTAYAGILQDEFGNDAEIQAIGGRALREMTRIAASPYSMWRDIAHTNEKNIAEALVRLEQRLAHIRENLRGPGLRDEFERGNQFRAVNEARGEAAGEQRMRARRAED
jgi:prephenate dehydrogenase